MIIHNNIIIEIEQEGYRRITNLDSELIDLEVLFAKRRKKKRF